MPKRYRGTIVTTIVVLLLAGGIYGLGQLLVRKGYGQKPDPTLRLPSAGDHTHASYLVSLCGEEQEPLPYAAGEIHSHGDERIHVHPQNAAYTGRFANLGTFFRTHGGSFSSDSIKYPSAAWTWKNGDACPDGNVGTVHLTVNDTERADFDRYVPQEGDRIEVTFN